MGASSRLFVFAGITGLAQTVFAAQCNVLETPPKMGFCPKEKKMGFGAEKRSIFVLLLSSISFLISLSTALPSLEGGVTRLTFPKLNPNTVINLRGVFQRAGSGVRAICSAGH